MTATTDNHELRVKVRDAQSRVIHALAAIVNVHTPDELFDKDAIPREPVMRQVVRIREAADELAALLTRTEAGADGAVPFCYVLAASVETLTGEVNFLCNKDRQTPENTPLYTHPQDASGDAEDAARWRYVRDDGLIWRVNMLALAKDDIDILFGAKADAAVDDAMQAKEAK